MTRPLVVLAAFLATSCATTELPTGSATIGLVFDQILVDAYVQDRGPFTCIVDSAAATTSVTPNLARELRMPDGGAPQGKVALPGNPADTLAIVERDLAAISREIARPVHCALGQNWLERRVVEIDYPRRLLTVAPTSPRPLCREFPMRFAGEQKRTPMVDVQVNGQPLPMTLETADDLVLRLAPDGARRAAVEGMGVAGKPDRLKSAADTGRGIIRNLELGPLAMSNVSVVVRAIPDAGASVGALGNGFFKAGVLTLDYPNKRVRVCAART